MKGLNEPGDEIRIRVMEGGNPDKGNTQSDKSF